MLHAPTLRGLTLALGAMRHCVAPLILFLALCGPASADEPLRPPHLHTVCSASGAFCTTSDPAQETTVVASSSGEVLWSIPGWHRWLFVANDGESVVIGYDGMNLVPVDVSLDEPVLFFYDRGDLVRTVRLGDLYQRRSQLRRTASHFAWAHIPGFNGSDQLIVELVNGKKVAFSAKTGKREKVRSNGT